MSSSFQHTHIMFIALALLLLSLCTLSECGPVRTPSQAEIYLSKFGYLPASARNPAIGELLDARTLTEAVQEFQSFNGLNVTGDVDEETMKLMSLPRCGVSDRVDSGSNGRAKRYALQGSHWRVKNLTYKISKYPKRLRDADVDAEVERAFGVWSEYTDLTFTPRTSGSVDIEIKFLEKEHGDGDAFDGVGGTLAHAFYPNFGGDAHFDDAEIWTIDSKIGTNLFQVVAHEFGHSLGLNHSNLPSALMTSIYRGYNPNFHLHEDDIWAIQEIYGRKTNIDSPKNEDDICVDPSIDTLFRSHAGSIYAFKNDKYYKLIENGVAEGYPKLISDGWPGLPSNIDAAFTSNMGNTYFFKGTKYWMYGGNEMYNDYPRDISEGFPGIPDNLDAALYWEDNIIYFFKDDKFWEFNPYRSPQLSNSSPMHTSYFNGLPHNLDAALQYNNFITYFFKGVKYYRFNKKSMKVDLPSSRPSGPFWFGCEE